MNWLRKRKIQKTVGYSRQDEARERELTVQTACREEKELTELIDDARDSPSFPQLIKITELD